MFLLNTGKCCCFLLFIIFCVFSFNLCTRHGKVGVQGCVGTSGLKKHNCQPDVDVQEMSGAQRGFNLV